MDFETCRAFRNWLQFHEMKQCKELATAAATFFETGFKGKTEGRKSSDKRPLNTLRKLPVAAAAFVLESLYVPFMIANSISCLFFNSSSPSACCKEWLEH